MPVPRILLRGNPLLNRVARRYPLLREALPYVSVERWRERPGRERVALFWPRRPWQGMAITPWMRSTEPDPDWSNPSC